MALCFRWRFTRAAARLPFLFAKELIYNERFFETNEAEERTYARLADVLYQLVQPRSVVDVGCGRGLILARFAEKGVGARGIEGSRHAIRRSRIADRITRANLDRGVPVLGRLTSASAQRSPSTFPGGRRETSSTASPRSATSSSPRLLRRGKAAGTT